MTQASPPPVPPHRTLIHMPKLPADQPSKTTKPKYSGWFPTSPLPSWARGRRSEEHLCKATHRQDHVSKDNGTGGTPAALSGVCFNCWGTVASGSTALRAAGPRSDHPHLLSLFFSRLLPAARLVLTAFPRLQPSHCLKLLFFEQQP